MEPNAGLQNTERTITTSRDLIKFTARVIYIHTLTKFHAFLIHKTENGALPDQIKGLYKTS